MSEEISKIEAARREYADWCSAVGIDTIEKLNSVLADGQAIRLINLCEKEYATSHRIIVTAVNTGNLEKGALLVLEWNPDRRVLIEHLSSGNFQIRSSQNSKLRVGDIFHCDRMLPGQPCYIDHLIHEGAESPYYVMGLQGGLTKIEQVQKI